MTKFTSKKSGSALILTILTITTILVTVLSVCKLVKPYIVQSQTVNDSLIAENAAQTGMDMVDVFSVQTPLAPATSVIIDIDINSIVSACPVNKACITYISRSPNQVTVIGSLGNISKTYNGSLSAGIWTWTPAP